MTTTLLVDNLVKTYRTGGRTIEAVQGVSFEIAAGGIFAFLGPNGAGKTTTIKMIAGLVEPTRGKVLVSGRDPHRDREVGRQIGAVLEGSRNIYWRLTPEENLEYFGALRGLSFRVARQRGLELLDRFGLADRRGMPVRALSRGMQQKVAIAVAVLHEPSLLLLDEPTLGLDVRASEEVKRLVRELAGEGRAILLTTHHLTVAEEIADEVAVIQNGKLIVQGGMQDVLASFSDTSYRITYQGSLQAAQVRDLARFQTEVRGDSLIYLGSASGLYEVLQILYPLEIDSVTRDRKSLTDVFLELTHETSGA
ncbi:MAG TPA: ABC transporter ATP-binding protein [Longimicrobiaceae bacterium]|jgi:ABC-2 type transport system ATP-binding protein